MIPDMEKVIKVYECCKNPWNRRCEECPIEKDCCHDGLPTFAIKDALELLKRQKWHFFHVRELTDEEKIEHPDWVSITECDDYEPNNGEEFLYYRKCFNSIGIDTWDDDMWADYACTGDGENIEDGDAWMELPEKPDRR